MVEAVWHGVLWIPRLFCKWQLHLKHPSFPSGSSSLPFILTFNPNCNNGPECRHAVGTFSLPGTRAPF